MVQCLCNKSRNINIWCMCMCMACAHTSAAVMRLVGSYSSMRVSKSMASRAKVGVGSAVATCRRNTFGQLRPKKKSTEAELVCMPCCFSFRNQAFAASRAIGHRQKHTLTHEHAYIRTHTHTHTHIHTHACA